MQILYYITINSLFFGCSLSLSVLLLRMVKLLQGFRELAVREPKSTPKMCAVYKIRIIKISFYEFSFYESVFLNELFNESSQWLALLCPALIKTKTSPCCFLVEVPWNLVCSLLHVLFCSLCKWSHVHVCFHLRFISAWILWTSQSISSRHQHSFQVLNMWLCVCFLLGREL